MNTPALTLITDRLTRASLADKITAAELREVMAFIANQLSGDADFSVNIPFDKSVTVMAAHTITGALTFLIDPTNIVPGFGCFLALTANGVNTPNFDAFSLTNGGNGWVNDAGTVNYCAFVYTGTEYLLTIFQNVSVGTGGTGGGGGGTTPAAPTAGVVDDTADTFNWTNNPLFTALADYEYTLNGGSSYAAVTAKPIVVGNVAKAIGQVGVRVKSVGGNPVSATLYNASTFNVAAGPSLEDLNFSPSANGFAEISSNIWQGDSGDWGTTWNSYHRSDKKLAAGEDGYVEMLYGVDTENREVMLGFQLTADTTGSYPGMDYGGYVNATGNIWKLIAGSPSASSFGPTFGTGNYLRVSRVSGVIKLQYRAGSTVTDVDTLGTYAGEVYPYFVTNGNAKINNPKGFNLS